MGGVGFEQFFQKNESTASVGPLGYNDISIQNATNFNVGYVVGLGFDYPITQHWAVGSQYSFYGFPSSYHHQMIFASSSPPGSGITVKTKNSTVNTVQLNMNYRF